MGALAITMFIIALLIGPSRDHVHNNVSLSDRAGMDCVASTMDGRRSQMESGYQPDSDLDLHSSDTLVRCHQLILPKGIRDSRTEGLLSRSADFSDHIVQTMQIRKTWKSQVWDVQVLLDGTELNQKISVSLKTRMAESRIQVRLKGEVGSLNLVSTIEEWRNVCKKNPPSEGQAQLIVFQSNVLASTLRGAACTYEGWTWL